MVTPKALLLHLQANHMVTMCEIEKFECVGDIQKRVGTRLRRLKKDLKGVKLSDDKPIGGKGRLTDV